MKRNGFFLRVKEFAESEQICSAVTVTRCMRGTKSTENPVETPLDHPFSSKAMQWLKKEHLKQAVCFFHIVNYSYKPYELQCCLETLHGRFRSKEEFISFKRASFEAPWMTCSCTLVYPMENRRDASNRCRIRIQHMHIVHGMHEKQNWSLMGPQAVDACSIGFEW